MIEVSAIKCPKCSCTIYSRSRHDFRACECGACHVDGGFDYLKIMWQPEIEEPDIFQIEVDATKEQLFHDWNNRKDKFGIIYPKEK